MKQSLLVMVLFVMMCLIGLSGNIYAADCSVRCRHGECEVKNCDGNAKCKCNWLGNPVCKCIKKGIIEGIGDIADDIINPDK